MKLVRNLILVFLSLFWSVSVFAGVKNQIFTQRPYVIANMLIAKYMVQCNEHGLECGISIIGVDGIPIADAANSCLPLKLLLKSGGIALSSAVFMKPSIELQKYVKPGGPLNRFKGMRYMHYKFIFLPGGYPLYYHHHLFGAVGAVVQQGGDHTTKPGALAKQFVNEWDSLVKDKSKKLPNVYFLKSAKRSRNGAFASLAAIHAGLAECDKLKSGCYISISDASGIVKYTSRNNYNSMVLFNIASARAATAALTGIDSSANPMKKFDFKLYGGSFFKSSPLAGGKPIVYKNIIVGGIGVGISKNYSLSTKLSSAKTLTHITDVVYNYFLHHYEPNMSMNCSVEF